MSETPICKRCLLDEWNNAELFRALEEYIRSIPAEKRASSALTEQRLAVCQNCDELLGGTCLLCGCYVQVRAARSEAHCVKSADVW